MNIFARFNENPAITLQDIRETKCYGRTDARTGAGTDDMKTVYPPQTKFAGVIIISKLDQGFRRSCHLSQLLTGNGQTMDGRQRTKTNHKSSCLVIFV